jgi:hypothetical protein
MYCVSRGPQGHVSADVQRVYSLEVGCPRAGEAGGRRARSAQDPVQQHKSRVRNPIPILSGRS